MKSRLWRNITPSNHWGVVGGYSCRSQVRIVSGDVRDPHFCRQLTKGMDVIYHLAALIAIPYSYVAPDSYVDVNIRGTLLLFVRPLGIMVSGW